ncbi:MAG: hypothetical protein ACRCYP_01120 [Alphaproteobacteria bacterium]
MKLSLSSMVLFVSVLLAFEAFSSPGQFAPGAESRSVIRFALRQVSHPDIDELPLDLSMKSQNQLVSVNASVHEQVLKRLHEIVVKKIETKTQIRKPYGKLNLEALAHDVKKNPRATQKDRAARLGTSLRTTCDGLKRLRASEPGSVNSLALVNHLSCDSRIEEAYYLGRFHASLLVMLQKQGSPVAPLQEKIKKFHQITLAH